MAGTDFSGWLGGSLEDTDNQAISAESWAFSLELGFGWAWKKFSQWCFPRAMVSGNIFVTHVLFIFYFCRESMYQRQQNLNKIYVLCFIFTFSALMPSFHHNCYTRLTGGNNTWTRFMFYVLSVTFSAPMASNHHNCFTTLMFYFCRDSMYQRQQHLNKIYVLCFTFTFSAPVTSFHHNCYTRLTGDHNTWTRFMFYVLFLLSVLLCLHFITTVTQGLPVATTLEQDLCFMF